MNTHVITTPRVAGFLLLLSILIISGAAGLIAAQGRLSGMAAAFGAMSPATTDASGLRTIGRAAIPYVMAQLAGFARFTLLLYRADDGGIAFVALTLYMFAAAVGAIEGSFHATVTVWAAVAWSLLALPLYFLVLGAPLVMVLTPLLFAIGLLWRG